VLWALREPEKLSAGVRDFVDSGESEIRVSAISLTEIGVKRSIGKLSVPDDFPDRLGELGAVELPLTWRHGWHVATLPLLHRDPFDRLLVSQAQLEGLSIVTSDPRIAAYDVHTVAAA